MAMIKIRYQSDDQATFVKSVSDWVKKPDPQKSKMPGAIRRFKLMPTFPIPEEEIKKIAEYIYKTDFTFPGNCQPAEASKKPSEQDEKKAKPQARKNDPEVNDCDDTNCHPEPANKNSKAADTPVPSPALKGGKAQ
ncbi:hypothetical protein HW115_01540 [Verrucomicrobiaceae bacterium N1E253]|uniref:Uncharacterized protein n=1 Tax=Oceaniferula marina TaxID=2748318 RepID=A0A851GA36_9BACT|nr:hypothetical protein [Oceaniferula marina]NWK54276.1 hypothetical protein [Oceaniferula marina]